MTLDSNIQEVDNRINKTARRVGRNPKEIKLVVAGKYANSEKIKEVIKAGAKIIGENREQDLRHKFQAIGNKVDWHFIGHLQRNKAKSVIKMVSMIHSIDSLKLAEELEKRLSSRHKKITALIEVNTSKEKTKHGVLPSDTLNLIVKCSQFKYLKIAGLMTMGILATKPEDNRKNFVKLAGIAKKIKEQRIPGIKMKHLSMGTTQDFEVAIEEGATLVRIGSTIFKD